MASVSEEIFKINEEGTSLNTKKMTKIGVSVIDGKFFFLYSFILFLMVNLVLALEIDCRRLVVKLIFAQIFRLF